MNLSSIALKNITRNFRNYFLFIISTTFAVTVFYMFLTLFLNPDFYELGKISQSFGNSIRSNGIIVAVFSSVFIWYSNNFFIRTRKKEMGIYSLQGMTKKQIGAMLFFENISIGLFSFITGILLGTLFSRLFSMAFVNFMNSIIDIDFVIVPEAIWITIAVFLFIFFISALQSYFIIYRFRLIDLFKAEKEGERPPRFSVIIAVLSIILLSGCYAAVFLLDLGVAISLMIPIAICAIIATFGFFHSSILLLIKWLKKNKKFYYKNILTTSLLYYRIKSNAMVLATISIITAIVLAAMGATYTFYKGNEDINRKIHSYSYMYIGGDDELDTRVITKIGEFPNNKVVYKNDIPIIMGKADVEGLEDRSYNNTYLISETNYNGVLRQKEIENKTVLKGDTDCIYLTQSFMGTDEYSSGMDLKFSTSEYVVNFKIVDFNLSISSYNYGAAIVVKDDVFNMIHNKSGPESANALVLTGIQVENDKNSKELTRSLASIIPEERMLSSFYTDYTMGLYNCGPKIFAGVFLSILFILAACSIIYFKQLTEANENMERFQILKKIGVDPAGIRKIVSKNIMIVFLLPLIMGMSHSFFALYAFSRLVRFNIGTYILPVFVIYLIAYIFFYFLTVISYTGIVSSGGSVFFRYEFLL